MRSSLVALLGAASVAWAAPAWAANALEQFGFGPRGAAMAGALTADAHDYTAVHYNPSLLVQSREVNFGFAFQASRVTPSVETLSGQQSQLDCSACEPPDAAGVSAGFVFPLAGKVQNRVAVGLGVYLPSSRLLRVRATDPDRPHWYHFNSSPDGVVIHLGAGIRVTETFNLGVGAQVLANLLVSGANLEIDLFSKEVDTREIDSHLATRAAPSLSLSWAPVERLRFGFNYRGEIAVRYLIPARLDLDGIGKLDLEVTGVAHYQPHTFRFGAAWDLTKDFTLTVDGTFARWSNAPSPYLSVNVDLSGETIDGLGLGDALDFATPAQPPGFEDTLSGAIGGELRVGERFAARGGAFFRPTPVPLQDAAETNVLDGTTVGVGAGVGVRFDDPLEVFAAPVQLDAATQLGFVLGREAHKAPTDNVPSYAYSARVISLTVALGYEF